MATGIEIGPGAIFIGVVGYLLKHWWDRKNELRDRKEKVYAKLGAVDVQDSQTG